MFQREALKAGQLSICKASYPGRMGIDAAAARNRILKREIARVARSRFFQLEHCLRVVVWEVAGYTTVRIINCCEFGAVREASAIFWFAVCGLRKVWQRFARAQNTTVRIRLGSVEYLGPTMMQTGAVVFWAAVGRSPGG